MAGDAAGLHLQLVVADEPCAEVEEDVDDEVDIHHELDDPARGEQLQIEGEPRADRHENRDVHQREHLGHIPALPEDVLRVDHRAPWDFRAPADRRGAPLPGLTVAALDRRRVGRRLVRGVVVGGAVLCALHAGLRKRAGARGFARAEPAPPLRLLPRRSTQDRRQLQLKTAPPTVDQPEPCRRGPALEPAAAAANWVCGTLGDRLVSENAGLEYASWRPDRVSPRRFDS